MSLPEQFIYMLCESGQCGPEIVKITLHRNRLADLVKNFYNKTTYTAPIQEVLDTLEKVLVLSDEKLVASSLGYQIQRGHGGITLFVLKPE